MPKGTRVSNCVEKVKRKGSGNPYAICQAATGQSYATGKPLGHFGSEERAQAKRNRKHMNK